MKIVAAIVALNVSACAAAVHPFLLVMHVAGVTASVAHARNQYKKALAHSTQTQPTKRHGEERK